MLKEDGVNKNSVHLEEIVDELYNYRDLYFENNPIENAIDFHSNLKKKVEESVGKIKSLEDDALKKDRALYFYVLGKAYNVESEYNSNAEEFLSKAVKLNPKLIDAWNHLGDSYFKKGEYLEAKNCFLNALNKEKNKVSLRNLSVVSRKECGKTKEDLITNVNAGLKYAQEALEVDPNDGTSWFYMGNAFMSIFFTVKQSAKTLIQAMDAYNRSESDKSSKSNPDLHYNKAVALKFQEEYESALLCFDKAHSFDPQWETPKLLQERLIKYLNRIQDLINQRGKVKNRKLQNFIKNINPEKHLGHFNKLSGENADSDVNLKYAPLSELRSGLNENKVILGVVVCSVLNEELVPFTFCIVDKDNVCVGVTVYNLANGQGVIIGDTVAIAMPYLKQVDFAFGNNKFNFKSVRISNPLLLAVNGKPLPSNKMSSMQMSTFSEADNKI